MQTPSPFVAGWVFFMGGLAEENVTHMLIIACLIESDY